MRLGPGVERRLGIAAIAAAATLPHGINSRSVSGRGAARVTTEARP